MQFLREIEFSRLWIRKEQAGHPHDLMPEIPLRKEPTYRSMDFFAVRNRMSPAFAGWCGAFTATLGRMQEECRDLNHDQRFRYLCEVQVLLDTLTYSFS